MPIDTRRLRHLAEADYGRRPPRYQIHDVIEQSPFGSGSRLVFVQNKEADIKNGRPGFDGLGVDQVSGGKFRLNGHSWWGYDDDVVRVVASAADARFTT